jgi:arsenate reductase (thioredoxin)
MRFTAALGLIVSLGVAATAFAEEKGAKSKMFPEVAKYLQQRQQEFDQIPSDRKAKLEKIAEFVKSRLKAGEPAKLTFMVLPSRAS